jgi:hypothetical protein
VVDLCRPVIHAQGDVIHQVVVRRAEACEEDAGDSLLT